MAAFDPLLLVPADTNSKIESDNRIDSRFISSVHLGLGLT